MNRPPSFAEEWSSDWGAWVLERGLPELPAKLAFGEAVPVARWAGPAFGAVIYITRDEDEGQERWDEDVEPFVRSPGGWEPIGSTGGTKWPPEALQGIDVPPNFAAVGGSLLVGLGDGECCAFHGIAGRDARFVELIERDETTTNRFDSPVGIFVVCFAPPDAVVRVLDGAEAVLLEEPVNPWSPL